MLLDFLTGRVYKTKDLYKLSVNVHSVLGGKIYAEAYLKSNITGIYVHC